MTSTKETVTALCRLLTRGDEADRCHASRTLGRLKDPKALPALVERLYDEDPDVCIDAAEALGEIGDREAVPPLLDLLQHHPDGEARTAAIEALAKIPDPRVPGALLEIAAGRPENLAWEDEWDDWWDMQLHAIEALGRMRVAEAVPVLERLLEDEDSQGIETELLTALARIGGDGLKVLEQRLEHGTPAERRRVAVVLGQGVGDDAIALLGRALLDRDPDVRAAGIRSLGDTNARAYLKVVLVSLKDPDARVRNAAVETCTRLATDTCCTEELLDQLTPLLEDEIPLVRMATIKTLTTLARTRPLPAQLSERICLRVNDEDPGVAAAACRFLIRNPHPRAESDLLQISSSPNEGVYLRQLATQAVGSLTSPGDEAIETLVRLINDPEQPVRLEALNTLMKLAVSNDPGIPSALDTVLSALRGTLEVRREAVPDITPEEPPTAMPLPGMNDHSGETLEPKSHHPSSTLGAIATAAQETPNGKTETSPPRDSVIDESESPQGDPTDLREYLELAETNGTAIEHRKPDIHTDIRLLAARVLASSNEPEAVAALTECLNSELPELCKEAATSLGRIASHDSELPALQSTIGPLMTQIESGNVEVRHACTRTLALLGNPESLPFLLEALQDDSALVRMEVIDGLVQLTETLCRTGDEESIPFTELVKRLLASLSDPSSGVRLAAARGLATLLPKLGGKTLETEVIRSIVSAAFADHGAQARNMGKILAMIEGDFAVEILLRQLETQPTSAGRRIVIELLEEILLSRKGNLS